jgi:hypothetical protein
MQVQRESNIGVTWGKCTSVSTLFFCEYGTFNRKNITLMIPISQMMVPTITLFGTLNFYLLI